MRVHSITLHALFSNPTPPDMFVRPWVCDPFAPANTNKSTHTRHLIWDIKWTTAIRPDCQQVEIQQFRTNYFQELVWPLYRLILLLFQYFLITLISVTSCLSTNYKKSKRKRLIANLIFFRFQITTFRWECLKQHKRCSDIYNNRSCHCPVHRTWTLNLFCLALFTYTLELLPDKSTVLCIDSNPDTGFRGGLSL